MYQSYRPMADIASRYTKLYYDPVSRKHFGKCPFCHGSTATFSTDNKTGTFFCYGCGAGGTRKDFMIRMKEVSMPISIPDKEPILSQIYEEAAYYYYEQLMCSNNIGKRYLLKRGITKANIAEYGLGYAPDTFANLYNIMRRQYPQEDLMRSGLFKISQNGNPYDFFRNRVIFPIMDRTGDVIAFGGRVMDDSKPKYINSPESVLFSKRNCLYGYPYDATNRKSGIIICEGYMDYIAVHSAGFSDCAAVLGTALTEEHARLIASDYTEVYLSMDSDGAGIHAAKKSIAVLEKEGLTVRVLDLKPHKDPDEFIRKNPYGAAGFAKRTEQALPAYKFLARHAGDMDELINILIQQVS